MDGVNILWWTAQVKSMCGKHWKRTKRGCRSRPDHNKTIIIIIIIITIQYISFPLYIHMCSSTSQLSWVTVTQQTTLWTWCQNSVLPRSRPKTWSWLFTITGRTAGKTQVTLLNTFEVNCTKHFLNGLLQTKNITLLLFRIHYYATPVILHFLHVQQGADASASWD